MRIAGVEIRDHPGFGDLDVDLRGPDGRAARLVVLAGENGCGKTAVLEAIFAALAPSDLLRQPPVRLAPGRYRVLLELDVSNTSNAFNAPGAPEIIFGVRERWPRFHGIVVDVSKPVSSDRDETTGAPWYCHRFHRLQDNMATIAGANVPTEHVLETAFACFYSEANVSFEVPRIDTVRTSAGSGQQPGLPPQLAVPVRGGASLATEVAQLLVDLKAADDNEAGRWMDENEGRPPDAVRVRRVARFTEAFARIAPNKRFEGVETVAGEHRVMFTEDGFHTPLADLSTGEKQAVFRGAFLLRRAEDLPGAVVLIDEPELSLHPSWQANILSYYDGIVREGDGKSSQVIVATHSPFVVHGSLTAKHIVLRRDRAARRVVVAPIPTYPGATTAEVAVAAFDLGAFAREAQGQRLALVVEGPTDKAILEAAWDKLRSGRPAPFVALPGGGARGVQQLLGSSEPGKAGPLLGAVEAKGTDRLLGLFDFDGEGYGQWNGTVKAAHAEEESADAECCAHRKRRGAAVWAALLPVPAHRVGYAGFGPGFESRSLLTIELLFPDAYVESLLAWVPAVGAPGMKVLQAATDAQKSTVAQAALTFPAEAFAAFEPILALVERVLGQPAAGTGAVCP